MSRQEVRHRERLEEYWDWFSVVLYLLVTVDMLTTVGAAVAYSPVSEANPLMEWLLVQGPVLLTVANLTVVVLTVYTFASVVEVVRRAPAPYDGYLRLAVEAWLGALVAMGLFIFANNLSVIVHGHSLLG